MSRENVDAVRGVYESWGRGDFSSHLDLLDPAFEFVIHPGLPDPGTYQGLTGLAGYMRGFLESWGRVTIAAEDLVDAGDAVVATVLQSGVGASSGAPGEVRYTHVWRLRDGAVIRLETFRDRDAALEATDLPT